MNWNQLVELELMYFTPLWYVEVIPSKIYISKFCGNAGNPEQNMN